MRKSSKAFWCFSLVSLCLMAGSTFLGAEAAAQQSTHGNKSSNAGAKTKDIKFEVISIRPIDSKISIYDQHLNNTLAPTSDGFISSMVVWQMFMLAYAPDDQSWGAIPTVNWPQGLGGFYTINARVSAADMEAWRNQTAHHELLRSAMRDLLKERCKLAVHTEPVELPDFKLVIGKNGLKMTSANPDSIPPKANKLPSGAFRFYDGPRDKPTWHYYGATISDLIEFISPSGNGSSRPPVHDETGLTGRYDFELKMIDEPSRDAIDNFPIAPLGLQLKPGKYNGHKLIIDHIEKPSDN